ncbi:ATP-dependent DNA ligase [Dehalogenimonas sp. WBC-2]|nr:ATP-dependent DNA ligase [Dehalogenimonas sp. WBC-2]
MDRADMFDLAHLTGARKAPMPGRLPPMLATLTEKPFNDPDWYFEPKLDGYRLIASVNSGQVRLQSRNFHDYTVQFPAVAAEMATQPVDMALFDGEIVALDEQGRPCFQCLQHHIKKNPGNSGGVMLKYYVFDLLYLNGYDLTEVPQSSRVKCLDKTIKTGSTVKAVRRFEGDGQEIFSASVKSGFEGIIAKNKHATYRPGKRSADWLKIKAVLTDEFVIIGYTPGQGTRDGSFGALVLAQYDLNGHLVYSGNVGTGFDEALLNDLMIQLEELTTKKAPSNLQLPLPSAITWVKPELVAEIKFAERTQGGLLRAPVFLRLREDKEAPEVKTPVVEAKL